MSIWVAAAAAAILNVTAQATDLPLIDGDKSKPYGVEQVADTAYRLAHSGIKRCPARVMTSGLTFQHIGQFSAADRPLVLAQQRLELGPAVLAIATGSPADRAGVKRGDILLAIDDRAIASTPQGNDFNQATAQAHSDVIDASVRDALARNTSIKLTVLRDGLRRELRVTGAEVCPSRVHLARSGQENAYADGTHVFLTTGLLQLVQSDDELAFIIAHEMAHNILSHAAYLRAQGVPRDFTRVLGRNGKLLRMTERKADELAIRLMQDAGYSPLAAIPFLARIEPGLSTSFLSAHDSVARRQENIRETMRQSGVDEPGDTRPDNE